MADEMAPWAIDGATLTGAQARAETFKATSGNRGVTLPHDYRVMPLDVPGAGVQITPGSGTLPNKYPGGERQSYGTTRLGTSIVNVPNTGSSGGKTQYLIQRIEDPEYGGQVPDDPANHTYDPFVLVGDIRNLNYPYVELARIVQPRNNATISKDMIHDLRRITNPLSDTIVVPRPNVTGDAGMELKSRRAFPVGEWFPNVGGALNNGRYDIEVPWYATKMQIRCEWLSVRYQGNPGKGNYWVTLGDGGGGAEPVRHTQSFGWDSGDADERVNWILEQEYDVLPEWRETVLPFFPRANRSSGSSGGYVGLTVTSGMVFSVRFLQAPEL